MFERTESNQFKIILKVNFKSDYQQKAKIAEITDQNKKQKYLLKVNIQNTRPRPMDIFSGLTLNCYLPNGLPLLVLLWQQSSHILVSFSDFCQLLPLVKPL